MDQNSSREMSGAAGLPDRVDGFALFLDIDGTLLDIADTPDGIVVPPGLAAALERLTARLGGALALVTGRSLATVERLFPGLSATVNGLHGAQWRDGSGRVFAPDTTEAFSGAKQRLREQAARWPGVVFEDKGPAFAAHYRLAPASEAQVRRLMQALAETVGDRWKLQEGKAVAELRPHGALLRKSPDGRAFPIPGQTYPTASVTGMPSAVKRLRTATRTWNSAT